MAVARAFLAHYRVALEVEKKSKALFVAALAPKHPRVQQAQQWLDHLTGLAVKQASAASSPSAASAAALAQPSLHIVPPALSMSSPYQWVSFERGVKGRLGLDEVLQLVESSARGEDRRKEDVRRAAEAEVNGVSGAHDGDHLHHNHRDDHTEREEGADGEERPSQLNGGHGDAAKGKTAGKSKAAKKRAKAAKAAKIAQSAQ